MRRRGEFFRVMRQGKRLVGRFLCLDFLPSKTSRLGISTPGRYGSSPQRNRFKRLVREAFRQGIFGNFDLHIIPRQDAKKATFHDIFEEISRLLK